MTRSAPTRTARRTAPPRRLLAAAALVALLGTGCANAPAETGSGGGVGGDQTGPTGPPPSPAELQDLIEERRESAQCLRENGVEDFPDPDANGYVLYFGDDPDLKSASEKCDDVVRADRAPK